jgi:Uma2 family endonuclease
MSVEIARHRFTVEQYERMGEAGIFSEDDRVELIEGEIVEMTPIGSRHAGAVNRLIELLTSTVGRRATVAAQNPIRIGGHSEPQPDLVLLRRREDFYAARHPEPADVLLVIEVADTPAGFDRRVKLPLYARAGIVEAWVLDLDGPALEVHRSPAAEGYRDVRRPRRGEAVTLAGLPDLSVAVDAVLG